MIMTARKIYRSRQTFAQKCHILYVIHDVLQCEAVQSKVPKGEWRYIPVLRPYLCWMVRSGFTAAKTPQEKLKVLNLLQLWVDRGVLTEVEKEEMRIIAEATPDQIPSTADDGRGASISESCGGVRGVVGFLPTWWGVSDVGPSWIVDDVGPANFDICCRLGSWGFGDLERVGGEMSFRWASAAFIGVAVIGRQDIAERVDIAARRRDALGWYVNPGGHPPAPD